MPDKIIILMVDRDKHLVEVIHSLLDKETFEIISTNNGMSALDQFYKLKPSLVILDLMLPDMKGEDICKNLKSNSKTPIIITTADDNENSILSAFNNGADDYMIKPFNTKELIARIAALLRRTYTVGLFPTDNNNRICGATSDNINKQNGKKISS